MKRRAEEMESKLDQVLTKQFMGAFRRKFFPILGILFILSKKLIPSGLIMKGMLREPLVHFLLIGAGLFLFFGWRGGPASLPGGQSGLQPAKIVVTRSDIDQSVETFTRTWQRPPTKEEVENLVEDFVRNEIYYREALAIGLDRDDSVMRRRMRLKMEFILEDIAAQGEPAEGDLQAFLQKHPERYLAGPQVMFRHVYVNEDKRGKTAEAYARQILARLNEGGDPDAVGDPFLLAGEIRLSPLGDIGKQFGEEFRRNLLESATGRWAGPVRSGFGLHLVFIEKRAGERLPALNEVRDLVKRDWAAERQKELKDAAYAKLRERYSVIVEKPKVEGSLAAAAASARTVTQ